MNGRPFTPQHQPRAYGCDPAKELDRKHLGPMHLAKARHRAFHFLNAAAASFRRRMAHQRQRGDRCRHGNKRHCQHQQWTIQPRAQQHGPMHQGVKCQVEYGSDRTGHHPDDHGKYKITN